MIVRQLATVDAVPGPPPASVGSDQSIDGQVQSALNLYLELKSPFQMLALLELFKAGQDAVNTALAKLHYVHFARFLPAPDGSALWVITTYDGELEPYILDFVGAMGDVFTAALPYIKDAPRLPVQKYPRDFIDFVKQHNVAVKDWSAYPQVTVIDIEREFGIA